MRRQIIYKPIVSWPGELRLAWDRKGSQFSAEWPVTESLLIDEAFALQKRWTARSDVLITVQVATTEIRRDAQGLMARAAMDHPGVIVNFGSRHGEMQMWSDRFDRWRDNVRGIALALEASRKIERYGVGRGDEQYQGWLAIEAGTSPDNSDEAFIAALIGWTIARVPGERVTALTLATRKAHPDTGGNHEAMVRVNQIRAKWLGPAAVDDKESQS